MDPATLRLLADISELQNLKQPLEQLIRLLKKPGNAVAFKQLMETAAMGVIFGGKHLDLPKLRLAVGLTSLKTQMVRLRGTPHLEAPVEQILTTIFGPTGALGLPTKVLREALAPSELRDACVYYDVHSSPLKSTFVDLLVRDMARDGYGPCELIDLIDIATHQLPRGITHVVSLHPVSAELLPERLTKQKRIYLVRKIGQRSRALSSFHLMSLVDMNKLDRSCVAYLGIEAATFGLRQKGHGHKRKKPAH